MKEKTFTATIFIAGDLQTIRDTCRRYCLQGLCVTITPTEFIFTGGSEAGAAIGLINYPRFPSSVSEIKSNARLLAILLMEHCCQRSCTVLCSDDTEYIENPDIVIPR